MWICAGFNEDQARLALSGRRIKQAGRLVKRTYRARPECNQSSTRDERKLGSWDKKFERAIILLDAGMGKNVFSKTSLCRRHDEGEDNVYAQSPLLLWRRGAPGAGRTRRNGLLPLLVVPLVVRRTRVSVRDLEAAKCPGHKGRGAHRQIHEDGS